MGALNSGAGDTVLVYPASLGFAEDVISSGGLRAGAEPIAEILISEAKLGAPIRRWHKNVLCVGWNYWDHFEESQGKREGQDPEGRPMHPTFFTKSPRTVIGTHDSIECDFEMSEEWDYEAEVAIVIGRSGKNISEKNALDHVFGLTLANDVSVRDVQRAHGGQWFKGKSIDRTMPLGPWITTLDEIVDLGDIRIECELNGKVLQDAQLKQMAFPIPTIIAELSRGMTLDAGDVILTGTPSGVGNAREPKVFLRSGDELVTRASGLGALKNHVL
jgi:2-keto-4-pentenoate hydratase/2-oxohepta-3-ene-1,7-dioic acid hydratase in catechol pathway